MDRKRGWFEKDISGCSLTGFICEDGKRVSGEAIIQSIALMNERSNGLGGGFAGYGIYPEMKDLYALHLMFDDAPGQRRDRTNPKRISFHRAPGEDSNS